MNRKILYVDMDNVIVDFMSGVHRLPNKVLEIHASKYGYRDSEAQARGEVSRIKDLDDIPGVFSLMDPVAGAVSAMTELAGLFDLYVLSTSPWNNPSAWSDKLNWIKLHFGADKDSVLFKRLILSHHKNLNDGHFLIDDRKVHGAEIFGQRPGSEHIHFGQQPYETWPEVVAYLRTKA